MFLKTRSQYFYAAAAAIIVPIGAASRLFPEIAFPRIVYLFSADLLWATVVYLFLGFNFPQKSVRWLALAAISCTFLQEISQLSHAVWLENLQSTWVGFVVLGHEFCWRDLVCYSIGIWIGAQFDLFFRENLKKKATLV
jgi:Protein of unknown function (DUF2809)